jgi:hypothetical protein
VERAARYGHGVALVFLDLDRFKELNDTYGTRRAIEPFGGWRRCSASLCAAPTSPGAWAATSSPPTWSRPTRKPVRA